MSWQDLVLTLGSLVFVFALVPSILSQDKPAFATSAVTATVLVAFAVTYATLSLWFAAATTGMTSLCWCVLAIQKFKQK